MKNSTIFVLAFITMAASSGAAYGQSYSDSYNQENDAYQNSGYQNQSDISYQTFYDDLSPYGQWINYPQYGYVWQPSVADDFKPYATNGHWSYTDLGWTWVSGYDWGWATFHYGRWFYDNDYGWMWQPGYEWAPAWVSWRNSDDYYGWAPLTPEVSLSISIGSYNPPINYWCFTPHQYVANNNVYDYCVNEGRNTTIINNSAIINNTVINNYNNNGSNRFFAAGPNANEVGQFTHSNIRSFAIRDNNRAGVAQVNNNEIRLFRPRVNASVSNSQKFAPTHVNQFSGTRQNTIIATNNKPNPVNNEVQFNNANNNNIPINKSDNRSVFMNRRNDIAVNNQATLPVANGRNGFLNNDNRNFQKPVQQVQQQPVTNNQRQAVDMPFFRNNGANGNGRVQSQPSPQRNMNMQPQVQNKAAQQSQPNSPFENRGGFQRRVR